MKEEVKLIWKTFKLIYIDDIIESWDNLSEKTRQSIATAVVFSIATFILMAYYHFVLGII